jgi:flagellin
MPITIASNIASLGAQRQLGKVSESLGNTFERLASGMRINKASDDAAGLAIANSLTADSRIFSQAIRNLNDGISVTSISEGALKQLSDIIIRQTELAEQSANGTYSLTQRSAMQTEIDALSREHTRIIQSTTFNGIRVIDDSATAIFLQAGRGEGSILSVDISDAMRRNVGTGSYGAQVTIASVGSGGRSIASGDLNGDGRADLVTSSSDFNNVTVNFGNGDGTFGAGVSYSMGGGAYSVTLADFNNDGSLDVATANFSDNSLTVRLNNGNGTFGAVSTISGLTGVTRIEAGDFNGDGRQDLMVAGTNFVGSFLGAGNGTFGSITTIETGNIQGFDVGDINGDGVDDVALSNTTNATTRIRLGSRSGSFSLSTSFNPGTYTGIASLGDFNRDGRLDLFIGAGGLSSAQVWLQQANGSFSVSTSLSAIVSGTDDAVSISDINNDGFLDITYGSTSNPGSINQLIGNGDGTFRAGVSLASGLQNEGLTMADFNGDGVLDIATSSAIGTTGRIHIANTRRSSEAEMYNIMTQAGAREVLDKLRTSLDRVSQQLGVIGSGQSRIGFAINNLAVSRENYISAASRIMDVDVAQESSELIRKNILQQAAASVLGQANIQPQLALSLLRG